MDWWTRTRTAGVVALVVMAAVAVVATEPVAAVPRAATTTVLEAHTMSGEAIECPARPDGIRVCTGDIGGPGPASKDQRLVSFDGVPLALYVTLPDPARHGDDEPRPLVVQSHGWGMPPSGPEDAQYGGVTALDWAAKGYVVVQLQARGWGNSCGTLRSRQVDPDACEHGYLRLADHRYEIRDIQHTVGLLVDEGLVDPARIAVTGESYGAGTSLSLATLKDRVMLADGTTTAWESPAGVPLSIAAAAPLSGWSDLIYALMPNGRTLDDRITSPTDDFTPVGVWKQSIDRTLYAAGSLIGYYSPEGEDPEADITTWFDVLGAGEPYDTPETAFIIDQIARYHSPYHLLDGAFGVAPTQPPPLLLAAGFTDAIFPGDEYVRYTNLLEDRFPDADYELFFYDGGHQRGQNKPADKAMLRSRIEQFVDHHIGGLPMARPGGQEVTALTQTCPGDAPSDGPYHAADWHGLHPDEVTHRGGSAQMVDSEAGDAEIAAALDPIRGGPACTEVPAADQGAGVATYRFDAATGDGYTMLGSPTLTARVDVQGEGAYVAARLFDVDPATDTQVLVARGVYRIEPGSAGGPIEFQLAPNGWHFAAGHVPKLELLGQDAPYLAPSTGEFQITVADLEMTLPVRPLDDTPAPAEPARPVAARPAYTG